MNLQEYQLKALKFANDELPHREALAVWALGLGGESAEVIELIGWEYHWQTHDRAKILKELGDVLWYAAMIANQLEEQLPFEIDQPRTRNLRTELVLNLISASGSVQELIKKYLGQGHPLNLADLNQSIANVLVQLDAIAAYFNFTLAQVAQANIEKLDALYPDGFSSNASINRHV